MKMQELRYMPPLKTLLHEGRPNGHSTDQDCVDSHTDHHEESLKCQGEQAFEIIVSDIAPFFVGHGRKRNRCYGSIK